MGLLTWNSTSPPDRTTRATQLRAMSLPRFEDEAAMRALDRKCNDPKTIVSKRAVAQLSAQPLKHKELF